MKMLLVPSDFSGCAQNALNFALVIAEGTGAAIKLLHVYPAKFDFASRTEEYDEHQEHHAEEKFSELIRRINEKEEFRSLNVTYEIRKGSVINEVLESTRENDASLIVMGTLGAGGIKNIIGSNTSEVTHQTEVPILSIPANFRADRVKRLVFATNLHMSDIDTLTTLAPIIKNLGLPLEVIHVYPKEEKMEDMLYKGFISIVKEKIPGTSITFHTINMSDVEKALGRLVNEYKDAILVLTTYEKEFFERLLKVDIAEEMVLSSTTPVLVMKGRQ